MRIPRIVPARLAALAIPVLGVLAAVAVYAPAAILTGRKVLHGVDFLTIHARRMAFAREALLGPRHELPAWYPRELMGTPFWSNVQSFPFSPTRLAVILAFPPDLAFSAGVLLAAALATVFTWAFARRLGMSTLAAVTSGFTFAASGFFASRVLIGNLPMLEAFCSLPLLLWLVDRVVRPAAEAPAGVARGRLLMLALGCACIALGGHPQLAMYSMATAAAYAWVVGERRRAAAATTASLLGVGATGAVLVPMIMLIGRSTRVLDLDRAANDWAMPYGRLLACFRPWRDGWPPLVEHWPRRSSVYPDVTLFFDTVNYLGLLPWLALAGLAMACLYRRRWPNRQGRFWLSAGAVALLMSLPFWQAATAFVSGTFLRSPARLMYIVTFSLALAVGAGLDGLVAWLRPRLGRWSAVLVSLLLLVHVWDLATHARAYVRLRGRDPAPPSAAEQAWLDQLVGAGRVGIDIELDSVHNRRFDDIGFFDSIMLARPYRFVIDTSRLPRRLNEQEMSARHLRPRTLAAAGVRLVATLNELSGLRLYRAFPDGLRLYTVDGAAERARFYRMNEVDFLDASAIHARLRGPAADLDVRLMLAPSTREAVVQAAAGAAESPSMSYQRPSSDRIEVAVATPESGYLRVLESWDPGWRATLDGREVHVVPGNDTFISVAMPAGRHVVTLEFFTPGRVAGWLLALASAGLLVLLLTCCGRRRTSADAR